MATYEERLAAVEHDLKIFKTETRKAYAESVMELAMAKGLSTDSVKWVMALRDETSERFDKVDQQLLKVDQQLFSIKQDIGEFHIKFDRLEKLLVDRFSS